MNATWSTLIVLYLLSVGILAAAFLIQGWKISGLQAQIFNGLDPKRGPTPGSRLGDRCHTLGMVR